MEKLLTFLIKIVEFFSLINWEKNLKSMDGSELTIDKQKPVFIIAVGDKKGGIARLATQSLDLFKKTVKKLKDEEVYYLSVRTGKKLKDIRAVAVYNRRIKEVVCRLDVAFMRLTNQSIRV